MKAFFTQRTWWPNCKQHDSELVFHLAHVSDWQACGFQVMRLRQGGLLWGGVPCSSFVWISRGTSRRSQATAPPKPCQCMPGTPFVSTCESATILQFLQANVLGDNSVEFVRLGNLCVVRFCLLVLLACSRNCIWAVEQPSSSMMPEHPRMQQLFQLAKQQKLPAISMVRLWMGLYGHFSAKATKIWGDASFA